MNKLKKLLLRIRTDQLSLDQIVIAAKFGDRTCLAIAAQAGITVTPIVAEDLCNGIRECGPRTALLAFMVLTKLFRNTGSYRNMLSTGAYFHTSLECLEDPKTILTEGNWISPHFGFTEERGLYIKTENCILEDFFNRLLLRNVTKQGCLHYICQVVVPYTLGEVEIADIQWPIYGQDKSPPIVNAWNWLLKKITKSFS